ncbi:MAG: helix-turn-helix domain-containing protein [Anaerolineales bacterium]
MPTLEQAFRHLTKASRVSVVLAIARDVTRTKAQFIAENALLRQQLILLQHLVQKPRFTQTDRLWVVLLASRAHRWKETFLILKPDTLLGWDRQSFRLFSKFKSRNGVGRPRVASETIALIQQMARENTLWGTERIRGELMKLGIQVASLP